MPDSQRSRSERLISIGRVALAALSLLAIWLDPFAPSRYAGLISVLLSLYLVYAVLVMALVPRVGPRLGLLQVISSAVDLIAFSAFMVLTEGPNSPFCAYFVFAAVSATLRWQWKGALWTSGIVVVIFFGLGAFSGHVLHDPAFELNVLVIQGVSLAVVGALLALLGYQEGRLRDEMGRLADWSLEPAPVADEQSFYGSLLGHASEVMGAPRVLLAWEEEDEPWLRFAYWQGGRTTVFRTAPGEFGSVVATDLEGAGFLCLDARAGDDISTVYGADRALRRRRGPSVDQGFAERFDIDAVVSVPVGQEESDGRLFFLDKSRITTDDLTSAAIVARGVGALMEEARMRACLQESAAFAERVRLAGDLHDGVLQSLTGTALQLETARRLLDTREPEAREIIESVQRSLVLEQRELRMLVDALKPGFEPGTAAPPALRTRLEELQEVVARQWGLQVDVVLEEEPGPSATISDDLTRGLSFIVHEGLVNSARHANARRAWATVLIRSDEVEVRLGDDGKGFPFRGRYDAGMLMAEGSGPVGLVRRVTGLGGTLTVDSSPEGSRIEIALPIDPVRVGAGETS